MEVSRALWFFVATALLSLTLLGPAHARADDEEEEEEAAPMVRREVPDLDGRPPSDENEALDALLWIPRVLTSPLYLLNELVLREGLGALVTELERAGLVDSLFESGTFGVTPSAFYEFGLSPSFGLFAFVDQFPFTENRLSVHAATFGEDWNRLIIRDRVQMTETMQLSFRVELQIRPDQIVEGIGYDAPQTPRGRFGLERIEARIDLGYDYWRGSALNYQIGYRSNDFRDRDWNGQPSVGRVGTGSTLVGFETGYELVFARADLLLDTHEPTGELTRGRFRLRVFAEQNAAFGGLTANDPDVLFSSFVRWGGELAVATDFLGRGRVFMLRFRTELVSPLDDTGLIPFFELPDAGGKGPLPGFITGQLRGQSVMGLTFEYVWPVYAFLDGALHISVGNAFGTHYEGFEWDRLRLSWGIGLVPRFSGEHLLELSFDVATETFERGAAVTQARVVVGARHGL